MAAGQGNAHSHRAPLHSLLMLTVLSSKQNPSQDWQSRPGCRAYLFFQPKEVTAGKENVPMAGTGLVLSSLSTSRQQGHWSKALRTLGSHTTLKQKDSEADGTLQP